MSQYNHDDIILNYTLFSSLNYEYARGIIISFFVRSYYADDNNHYYDIAVMEDLSENAILEAFATINKTTACAIY